MGCPQSSGGNRGFAGFFVADEEIVFESDPFDAALLVFDEEALAVVVVQVVAAEDEVVSDPNRLEAVGVGAVFPDLADLVAFDKQPDAVAIAVVVAVGPDSVFAKGPDDLVADDSPIGAGCRGGARVAGVDPEPAAGDPIAFDRHPVRAGLDLDFVGDVKARQGQMATAQRGSVDGRLARVLGLKRHLRGLRRRKRHLPVGAIRKADDSAGVGRGDRRLGGGDARDDGRAGTGGGGGGD